MSLKAKFIGKQMVICDVSDQKAAFVLNKNPYSIDF